MQAPYPPPHASPPQRSGAQRLRLLLRRQGVDKRIDFAVQHVVELMQRQVDAMVGDAGLREVVSANSFRAVARADHRTARLCDLRVLLRVGSLEQPRPQDLERARLVLVLRLLVPAYNHHPARDMRNPHGRVRRVDALAAGPRRTHYVDPKVLLLVDIDLDLVCLGQHRDGHRRSMNTARRFGGRYALHAMDTALELEPAVRAASAHQRDDFLDSAKPGRAQTQRLDFPSMALGKPRVHPEEFIREERRLLAAGSCADFEQDVLVVVGVAGREKLLEALLDGGLPSLQIGQLVPSNLAQFRVVAFEQRLMFGNLAKQAAIFANRDGNLFELGTLLGQLGVLAVVRDDRGIAQAAFQFRIALLDPVEFFDHRRSGRCPVEIKSSHRAMRVSREYRIPRTPGRLLATRAAGVECYLRTNLLYLRLKRSMRPAVSTRRCVPV